MQEKVARHVLRAVFRCDRELQDVLDVLKVDCDEAEFQPAFHAVAEVLAMLSEKLTVPILKAHPQFTAEIDADIETYGRLL